jgi:hypothetical protein
MSVIFWRSLLLGVQIRCLQNSGSLLRQASEPGDCSHEYSCAVTDNKTHRIILCRERPRAMIGVIGVKSDMCVSVEPFWLLMIHTTERTHTFPCPLTRKPKSCLPPGPGRDFQRTRRSSRHIVDL